MFWYDAAIGQEHAYKKALRDPNPMTVFGVRYQKLSPYKQFLSKKNISEKIKFMMKRAAFSLAKGAAGATVLAGVGGAVAAATAKSINTEHDKRVQMETNNLKALAKRIEALTVKGTPYSIRHLPTPETLPMKPIGPGRAVEFDKPSKKNKHVRFDDASNRYSASDW